jgi:hypothetical protein
LRGRKEFDHGYRTGDKSMAYEPEFMKKFQEYEKENRR